MVQFYGWLVVIGGGFATIATAEISAWAVHRLRRWRVRETGR